MVFDAGITGFSGTGDVFEESGEDARLFIVGFGAIDGEAGRLMKAFMVGVIGVLEGRGPGSMDNDGKCLNRGEDGISAPFTPFACEIDDRWVIPLLPVGSETGTDGNLDVNSSNSSMVGKACENSAIVECASGGEDDAEDVGEGGPRLEGGTTAWGDDVVELLFDGGRTERGGGGGADTSVGDSLCERMGSGDLSEIGRGVGGATGTSRGLRLDVSTANPASFNFLTRSAMEFPTRLSGPASALSSLMSYVSRV